VINIDLPDLLQASEAVLVSWSCVGFEAILTGRPVIVLNMRGRPDLRDYAESGPALKAIDFESLCGHVKNILSKNKEVNSMLTQKRTVYLQARNAGPGAASRLCSYLQSL
jgi:hypothetical protein